MVIRGLELRRSSELAVALRLGTTLACRSAGLWMSSQINLEWCWMLQKVYNPPLPKFYSILTPFWLYLDAEGNTSFEMVT